MPRTRDLSACADVGASDKSQKTMNGPCPGTPTISRLLTEAVGAPVTAMFRPGHLGIEHRTDGGHKTWERKCWPRPRQKRCVGQPPTSARNHHSGMSQLCRNLRGHFSTFSTRCMVLPCLATFTAHRQEPHKLANITSRKGADSRRCWCGGGRGFQLRPVGEHCSESLHRCEKDCNSCIRVSPSELTKKRKKSMAIEITHLTSSKRVDDSGLRP